MAKERNAARENWWLDCVPFWDIEYQRWGCPDAPYQKEKCGPCKLPPGGCPLRRRSGYLAPPAARCAGEVTLVQPGHDLSCVVRRNSKDQAAWLVVQNLEEFGGLDSLKDGLTRVAIDCHGPEPLTRRRHCEACIATMNLQIVGIPKASKVGQFYRHGAFSFSPMRLCLANVDLSREASSIPHGGR